MEGLLSYQGGKTYQAIHSLFSEIGYHTEGRTLMCSEYAIPQKRKRVILICTCKNLEIKPSELFPKPITPSAECQITARETIADLENVACLEETFYNSDSDSDIVKFFKGNITEAEYIDKHTKQNVADDYSVLSISEDENGQMKLRLK